jgi:hypothetical protein
MTGWVLVGLVGLVALLFVFSCNDDSDPDPVVNLEKRYVEPAARGAYITSNPRNVDASEYEEVTLEDGETIDVLKITLNTYEDFWKDYSLVQGNAQGETIDTFTRTDDGSIVRNTEKYARYLEIMDRLGDEEEVIFSKYSYLDYSWSLGHFVEIGAYKDCLFTSLSNENNRVYFVFEDERLNPMLDYDERYYIYLEKRDVIQGSRGTYFDGEFVGFFNKTILKNQIIKYQNGFVIKSEIVEVDKDFYDRILEPYPQMETVEFRVIMSNQDTK